MEDFSQDDLAAAFADNRQRLLALAEKRLNPILLKRLSVEDVLSEAYANAAKRLGYFAAHDDVPVYYKLRTILLQTLADIERRNLKAGARDAYQEVESPKSEVQNQEASPFDNIPADITSPASRVERDERHALLRGAIAALSENDRAIIELRHFDGMGNSECAAALGIEPKAASIRYVRALERLQQKLMELSCFQKNT